MAKYLGEHETKKLLSSFGITVNETHLVNNTDEALKAAEEVGYPVVLKVASEKIVHKSDVGGVILGVDGPEKLKEIFPRFMEEMKKLDPEAKATVQRQLPKGVELVVGTFEDESFGKVLMFGIGGIFVEVLKDVSFRLIPIEEKDAWEMLGEIKGKKLLEGTRGLPPVNKKALVELLLKVSEAAQKFNIKQLDLNPVLGFEDKVMVVDGRMQLG